MTRSSVKPSGSRAVDRLLEAGLVSRGEYDRVVIHARRTGVRIEEALLDISRVSEESYLKFLAGVYGTRFVTTQRLSTARVDQRTLKVLSRKAMEKLYVFPIVCDPDKRTLTVVAADVESTDVVREVQMLTSMREVTVFIARPAAIEALIRKYFEGDLRAFGRIAVGGTAIPLAEGEEISETCAFEVVESTAMYELSPEQLSGGPREVPAMPAADRARPIASLDPPSSRTALPLDSNVHDRYLVVVGGLVRELDKQREGLEGHSVFIAKIAKRMATKLGLGAEEICALELAALLHDVGKTSSYHFTAFNVAKYDGHRAQAEKLYQAPLELLGTSAIHPITRDAIASLYEAFDGSGFPLKAVGEAIPLAARILAVAETYGDLTTNPRNPYRKILKSEEACQALSGLKGSCFDPRVVDCCVEVALNEDLETGEPKKRGVQGSLSEMALPDVVQILAHGRKSGLLRLTSGGRSGSVQFSEGEIVDANLGSLRGEEAFYALLGLTDGDFVLDPSVMQGERAIRASTESLLLEGMRRLDES